MHLQMGAVRRATISVDYFETFKTRLTPMRAIQVGALLSELKCCT